MKGDFNLLLRSRKDKKTAQDLLDEVLGGSEQ